MSKFSLFEKRSSRIMPNYQFLFLIFCFIMVYGCASTSKPPISIDNYLINYPAPTFDKQKKFDDTIRVNRFTVAAAYNNNKMIFRQDNYILDFFNYNRWAVNPSDMIGDNLLRDLQASGFFRAAFSRYVADESRYTVQGGIDEFFLKIDPKDKVAVISLEITLIDTKQREQTGRIIFQKKYRQEEPLIEQSPGGYCQAMSLAMQKLSPLIINDINQGIKSAEK